jgi:hypothetical protein
MVYRGVVSEGVHEVSQTLHCCCTLHYAYAAYCISIVTGAATGLLSLDQRTKTRIRRDGRLLEVPTWYLKVPDTVQAV